MPKASRQIVRTYTLLLLVASRVACFASNGLLDFEMRRKLQVLQRTIDNWPHCEILPALNFGASVAQLVEQLTLNLNRVFG